MHNEFVRARALITRGWAKNHMATTRTGQPALYGANDAACWCLDGAIRASCGVDLETRDRMLEVVCKEIGVKDHTWIWSWNDAPERTRAEILRLLDRLVNRYA